MRETRKPHRRRRHDLDLSGQEMDGDDCPWEHTSHLQGFPQVAPGRSGDILKCHDEGVLLASSGPEVLLNI